ncbi:dynamin-related protein 3A-like [Rutidosis leptorrhynchoides]|uniref:dynamin-related protein 3A-like n=1 Tax=Rutidosis leptorrhynchoides TaxID=125765 RepID=UPI003A99B746
MRNDNHRQTSVTPLGSTVIPVVNKLREVLSTIGERDTELQLPLVAVVGSQSSGKSSVLEALVGRDFLPRGSDICTRRPLLLQLIHTDSNSDEYGEFLHLPGHKFFNFSQIRSEIQDETEREVGGNRRVSNKEICLKVYSPRVLDMTLVDLPGMTKVPVGDQPLDIETQIRNMILSYIKQRHCLILAITPANSDLANSDALQIAGIADPNGNRTIGVITKLDIMDRGTDARNLLLGKTIPLRLGYVGVVNRSQEDIELNRGIRDALESEKAFFDSHPVYNSVAECCGIPQLAKKLNHYFVKHVLSMLPELKSSIRSKLALAAKERSSYGPVPQEAKQGSFVLNTLLNYSKAFVALVDGRNEEMLTSEVYGGARIHHIFQSIFVSRLEETDPFESLTDEDIRTAIHNATGPRSALFVPEVPFQVLVRRQIARLLDPSLQCARLVYNELVKMSHNCLVHELQRFPYFKTRINEIVGNFLFEGLEPSQTMIGHIVEMEVDYINTSHPNFIGGNKAVENALHQVRSHRLVSPLARPRDGADPDALVVSRSNHRSNGVMARYQANGIVADEGVRSVATIESNGSSVGERGSSWRISSFFRGRDANSPAIDVSGSNVDDEIFYHREQASSIIHLREPPLTLNSSEMHSEYEAVALAVTKQLLESYYTIVRKKIQDSVPKAIMHFLVNHTKRELCKVLIEHLYRPNLFKELLQETDEVSLKRKQCEETLTALQEASHILDELPVEAATVERGRLGGS